MHVGEFLKLVGRVALRVVPVALGNIPQTAIVAPIVEHAIGLAEQAHSENGEALSGAAKLDLAMKLTADGVKAVNAKAGKVLLDPGLVNQALADGVSTTVDTVKLVDAAKQAMASTAVGSPLSDAQLAALAPKAVADAPAAQVVASARESALQATIDDLVRRVAVAESNAAHNANQVAE